MSIQKDRTTVDFDPDSLTENMYTVNLKKRDLKKIKKTALLIARKACPKDSHNMALNAIYAMNTVNGFAIVWDERFAYYLPYVDKGINPLFPNSEKVKANKGFATRGLAAVWCYFYYNPRNNTMTGVNALREDFEKTSAFFVKFEELYKYYISRTKEAPMFVNMVHDIQKGKSAQEVTKGNRRIITNLYKSIRGQQAGLYDEEHKILFDSDIAYHFERNQVFDISDVD